MKTKITIRYKLGVLFLILGVLSCTEDEKEIYEVKYEVLTTSGDWFGEYIIETGEKICICAPPLYPDGWTYDFQVSDKPFVLHIDATAECGCDEVDVTTNIYVNNKLVATNTSNWAPGVASADYVIE